MCGPTKTGVGRFPHVGVGGCFFSACQGDQARGRVWVLFTDMALRITSWGVLCLASPEECLSKAKDDATYVVQKHIPKPLLYTNGEKCHIKPLGKIREKVCVFCCLRPEPVGCSEWNFHPIAMVIFHSKKSMIEHGHYTSLMTGFLNHQRSSFCCSKLYSIDLPSSWVCWLKIVTSKYVWKGFGTTPGNVAGFVERFTLYTFKSFPHPKKTIPQFEATQTVSRMKWFNKKQLNIHLLGIAKKNLVTVGSYRICSFPWREAA